MTAVYSMTIGVTTILSVFLTKYFDKKKLFFSSMLIFGFGIVLSAISLNYIPHNNRKNFSGCRQWSGSYYCLRLHYYECIFKRKTGVVMGIYGFLFKSFIRAAILLSTLLLVNSMPWQFIMWGIYVQG